MRDVWFLFCVFGLLTLFFAAVFSAVAAWLNRRNDDARMAWWRHVTGLCVALAVAGVAGAADPGWRDVEATAMPEVVLGCIYIKQVSATGAMAPRDAGVLKAMPSATKMATALTLKRMKILTMRAGGDVVLITAIVARDGRAEMRGEAWRCEAR